MEVNLASVLFCLLIGIESLESSLKNAIDRCYLRLKHKLKRFLVNLLYVSGLLAKLFVSGEESLDGNDALRDAIIPRDHA